MSSGGGSSAPTQQTVTQTNMPEWIRPQYEQLIGQTQALTDINQNPWVQYGGDRVAPFSPMQQQAFGQLENMQLPMQTTDASNMAYNMANQAAGYQNYQPQQFANPYTSPQFQSMGLGSMNVQAPSLQNFQTDAAMMNFNPNLQNFNAQAATGSFNPNLQNFNISGPQMNAAQMNYNPQLQNFNATAAQNDFTNSGFMPSATAPQMTGPGGVGTDRWTDPGTAASYMSPYIEQAINPALDQLQRQSDIRQRDLSGQAQQAGAYGGYRHALQMAEEQRNTERNKGDLAAQMLNQGYGTAGQLFGTDSARALQAAMANQQTGLTTGVQNLSAQLQNQGLRAQTGLESVLANQNAQNQIGLANQQAGLGVQQLGTNVGLQGALTNVGNQQQAGLANQQAGLQAALANQQGQYGAQQLGTQTGLQSYLQNLQNQQQTNLANQQAGLGVQSLGANLGFQGAQANQSAQNAANMANLQSLLGVQQLGAGNNMQAQQLNQAANLQAQQLGLNQLANQNQFNLSNAQNFANYGLQAQQLGEQSRQFGANLGLQGLNTGLQGTGLLGQMGQQQYGQMLGLNQAQQLGGQQQQQWTQQQLDQMYSDFLSQQNWPYRNLGFLSEVLGRPVTNTTQSMYQAPPSTAQNLMGLGLGMYGLSGMMGGKKKGGLVKNYAQGGIADAMSTISALGNLPPDQLNKMAAQGQYQPFSGMQQQANQQLYTAAPQIDPMLTQQTPMPENVGIGQLPAPNMGGFADGGIVGFDHGGTVDPYTKWIRSAGWDAPNDPQALYERERFKKYGTKLGAAGADVATAIPRAFMGAANSTISGIRGLGIPLPYIPSTMKDGTSLTGSMTPFYDKYVRKPEQEAQEQAAQNQRELNRVAQAEGSPAAPDKKEIKNAAKDTRRGAAGANSQRIVAQAAAATGVPSEKIAEPEALKQKTPQEMAAQMLEYQKALKEGNPMYAERDKMADRYAKMKGQDPYAAAINAASAIVGGRKGMGWLEAAATGAAAAGQGQLGREKEHTLSQEKLLAIDAALSKGDLDRAEKLLGLESKREESNQERLVKIYEAKTRAASAREVAGIAAAAADRRTGMYGAMRQDAATQREQEKAAAMVQRINESALARAQAQAKIDAGINGIEDLIDPARKAKFNRHVAALYRQYLEAQGPQILRHLKKQWDGDEKGAKEAYDALFAQFTPNVRGQLTAKDLK